MRIFTMDNPIRRRFVDGLKQVAREFDLGRRWTGGPQPEEGRFTRTMTELDTPLTPPNILHAEGATKLSDLGETWGGEQVLKLLADAAIDHAYHVKGVRNRVQRARDALASGNTKLADQELQAALGSKEELIRQATSGSALELHPDGSLGAPRPRAPTTDADRRVVHLDGNGSRPLTGAEINEMHMRMRAAGGGLHSDAAKVAGIDYLRSLSGVGQRPTSNSRHVATGNSHANRIGDSGSGVPPSAVEINRVNQEFHQARRTEDDAAATVSRNALRDSVASHRLGAMTQTTDILKRSPYKRN